MERALRDLIPILNEWYRTVLNLPAQASDLARRIDALHYVEITIFTLIGIAFMGVTIVFLVRYRRRGEPRRTPYIRAPELVGAYAVVIFAIFAAFWFASYRQYIAWAAADRDAMPIYVTGKQWMWSFAYPEGVTTAGVLYLPVGRPVRLVMTSRDVIHSFYLPHFRVKQDVVPGAYLTMGIEADRPGRFALFCAELCGVGHSRMRAAVLALEPEDFDAWLRRERRVVDTAATQPPSAGGTDLPALGRRFAVQHGCFNCHTSDGRRHIGPTWAGIYGREEPLLDGTTVTVDPEYITESMMLPAAKIVAGFEPVMPSYHGLITAPESAAIVEYIRSLRPVPRVDEAVLDEQVVP